MTSRKKIIAFGAIALAAACVLLIPVLRGQTGNANKITVSVYYLNPSTYRLESEKRTFENDEDDGVLEIAQKLLSVLLYTEPKNKSLVKTAVSDYTHLAKGGLDNTNATLELVFSSDYNLLTPLEELYFRSSLVWTMTELDSINNIRILVDGNELLQTNGHPMGLLNRYNTVINPRISPEKVNNQNVILYFANEGNMLVPETRLIQVSAERPIEYYIVEQLIAGPKDANLGLLSTIPSGTAIKSLRTDEGVCYISFNSEFISKHPGGERAVELTIYSIVNSLTELTGVKRVRFLTDTDDFKGVFQLNREIERNEDLIASD